MTASDEVEIQCYNKGCGSKFKPAENGSDSCTYHPGPPVFHDAYKIWNCCNKKSTDFGTWLSYKGCTRGPHNGEKPVDIARVSAPQEIRPEKEDEVIVWNGLNAPTERPLPHIERVFKELTVEVTNGAKIALEKYKEQNSGASTSDVLRIGAPCRNSGCDKLYVGPDSDSQSCLHHPGQAVFHEGMKYWSCCNKKTSDFGAFLEQKGCEKGQHQWSKNEKVDKLREDHFSANGTVTVNVYCRGALPESISAKTDGLILCVKIVHGFGDKETNLDYELFGEILSEESLVRVGERKVELILKQKEVMSWPRLRYEAPEDAATATEV